MVVRLYGSPQWIKSTENKNLRVWDWNAATSFETANVYKVEAEFTQSGTYNTAYSYKIIDWGPVAAFHPAYISVAINGDVLMPSASIYIYVDSYYSEFDILYPGRMYLIFINIPVGGTGPVAVSTQDQYSAHAGTEIYSSLIPSLAKGLFIRILPSTATEGDIFSGTITYKIVGYLITPSDVTIDTVNEYPSLTPITPPQQSPPLIM